jgi:hypothetical protein
MKRISIELAPMAEEKQGRGRPGSEASLLAEKYGLTVRTIRKMGAAQLMAMTEDARLVMVGFQKHSPSKAAIRAAMKRISIEERMERKLKRFCRRKRGVEVQNREIEWQRPPAEKQPYKKPVKGVPAAAMEIRRVNRMMELARKTA